jgi:hypothetical protein
MHKMVTENVIYAPKHEAYCKYKGCKGQENAAAELQQLRGTRNQTLQHTCEYNSIFWQLVGTYAADKTCICSAAAAAASCNLTKEPKPEHQDGLVCRRPAQGQADHRCRSPTSSPSLTKAIERCR